MKKTTHVSYTALLALGLALTVLPVSANAADAEDTEAAAKASDVEIEAKAGAKPAEVKAATKPAEAKAATKSAGAKAGTKTSEAKAGTKPAESKAETKPVQMKVEDKQSNTKATDVPSDPVGAATAAPAEAAKAVVVEAPVPPVLPVPPASPEKPVIDPDKKKSSSGGLFGKLKQLVTKDEKSSQPATNPGLSIPNPEPSAAPPPPPSMADRAPVMPGIRGEMGGPITAESIEKDLDAREKAVDSKAFDVAKKVAKNFDVKDKIRTAARRAEMMRPGGMMFRRGPGPEDEKARAEAEKARAESEAAIEKLVKTHEDNAFKNKAIFFAQNFTVDELKTLEAFFSSAAGQKMIKSWGDMDRSDFDFGRKVERLQEQKIRDSMPKVEPKSDSKSDKPSAEGRFGRVPHRPIPPREPGAPKAPDAKEESKGFSFFGSKK